MGRVRLTLYSVFLSSAALIFSAPCLLGDLLPHLSWRSEVIFILMILIGIAVNPNQNLGSEPITWRFFLFLAVYLFLILLYASIYFWFKEYAAVMDKSFSIIFLSLAFFDIGYRWGKLSEKQIFS